jgi:hypothetical protein
LIDRDQLQLSAHTQKWRSAILRSNPRRFLIFRNAGFARTAPAFVTAVAINSRFNIASIASVNPSDNFNITLP